jgi:cobalt-zinc-cadmium efflux system protein
MNRYPPLPTHISEQISKARRLEWWTIFWLVTIIGIMYLVMGSSQAMQAAWVEDTLSLLPPLLFLVAARIERFPPSANFPFGLHRVGTLAFAISAATLTALGGYLIYDAAAVVIRQEHPTITSFNLWGTEIWLGWAMMAALFYSIIPPVILGRKKLRIAPEIQDKVLHADADMNAADWKTGAAGIVGIAGIAAGFWWADAAAAGFIGFGVLKDGLRNLNTSVAELLDGAPRQLRSSSRQHLTERIQDRVGGEPMVKVREAGRYLHVMIGDDAQLLPSTDEAAELVGKEDAWRVVTVTRPHTDARTDPSDPRKTLSTEGDQ